MSEVPLYGYRAGGGQGCRAVKHCSDFVGKEFQFKTLMQGNLLHECLNVTSRDHAV